MKAQDFKRLIKETVKEAIQEELKDILLEAVRTPKTQMVESYIQPTQPQPSTTSVAEKKAIMESIMGDMRRGQDTLNFTTQNIADNTLQVTPGMNTMGDGTKLPEGNVGLDMIMGLMNKK
jgi:hypothetical protein